MGRAIAEGAAPCDLARRNRDGPIRIGQAMAKAASKGGIEIRSLDHLVLTVADVAAAEAFYARVMGMKPVTFAGGRRALAFGSQKINLHQAGREFEPKAAKPVPGSADLCFLVKTPVEEVIAHLEREGVAIIEGPVRKTGATGPLRSVYFRDPDGNLIELSNPIRR